MRLGERAALVNAACLDLAATGEWLHSVWVGRVPAMSRKSAIRACLSTPLLRPDGECSGGRVGPFQLPASSVSWEESWHHGTREVRTEKTVFPDGWPRVVAPGPRCHGWRWQHRSLEQVYDMRMETPSFSPARQVDSSGHGR